MRKNKGKWLFAATFFNILCIIGLNQYEKTGINRKKVSTQHSRLHPAASGVKQKLACQATGNLECAERIACGFVTAQVLSSSEECPLEADVLIKEGPFIKCRGSGIRRS